MNTKASGFLFGLLFFFLIAFLPTFGVFRVAAESAVAGLADTTMQLEVGALARSMQTVLALLSLMVMWWVTDAVPLPATALMPALILPLFHVVGLQGQTVFEFNLRHVLVHYANPVIFLFLGGFLIAGAMQKWKLDRRFTLWFLTRGNIANDTRSMLFGLMAVTALLSMWISNTATAAMMLPLGLGVLSVLDAKPGESRFGTALMLGIAWSASVGGIGTIIGTPPNGIALGILDSTFGSDPGYQRITFLDWMKFGVPLVVGFLPMMWFLLIKVFPPEVHALPGGKERLSAERTQLSKMSNGEKGVLAIFLLAVVLWVSNPFWDSLLPDSLALRLGWIDEYSIGLFAGVILFLIPVNLRGGVFLLDWRDTKFVDWGTLLLFGGGIALSDAMFKTGLAGIIATSFVGFFGSPSTLMMVFLVVLLVNFLTEITSNTAVTSMMVPIVISIAVSTGENPVTLAVAAAVAASLAFMLPVATPPNALVYSTGYIRIGEMIKAGFWLDIIGWLFTVGILIVVANWIFGVVAF
ncbi:MAG: DASS family sodium-coupled anion symporter [Ignavibacteriae bacterium]|nr:DASS family sodium-coupled anion symporter [Ignavibacteriota bacterium]